MIRFILGPCLLSVLLGIGLYGAACVNTQTTVPPAASPTVVPVPPTVYVFSTPVAPATPAPELILVTPTTRMPTPAPERLPMAPPAPLVALTATMTPTMAPSATPAETPPGTRVIHQRG